MAIPCPAASPTRDRLWRLLGPAFVAAIAYVDPGNVAANLTAGARYGYTLLWVLVLANLAAMLIQYLSAKLGIVTGHSLPELLGAHLSRPARIAYWVQAEVVAAATDLAEIIGGALALSLLFQIPLLWGGIIISVVSLMVLAIQSRGSQRIFEGVIVSLLVVITLGFLAGLLYAPPQPNGVISGLFPRFAGGDSVIVAASMLGATVMPHAVYLHSSLVVDHHKEETPSSDVNSHATGTQSRVKILLRATRIDIGWALTLAGFVNIGLLLLAASALNGVEGTDTIEGAHQAISVALGSGIGTVFAIGLLASGLASTSVGAYAGSEIMKGLLRMRIPLLLRRGITVLPALAILGMGIDPTWALVVSQMFLSFGIPFAIIPLLRLTARSDVMGDFANTALIRWVGAAIAALIIALNALLIYLTWLEMA